MAREQLAIAKIQPSIYPIIATILSVEPRIINDQLYLRIQQYVLSSQDIGCVVGLQQFATRLCICLHLSHRDVSRFIQVNLGLLHDTEVLFFTAPNGYLNCVECDVEFELEK